jgi:hypothetical protein
VRQSEPLGAPTRAPHPTTHVGRRTAVHICVSNDVQRILRNGAPADHGRPSEKKADPVLPRSAAIGSNFGLPLNLRVVGSIPTRLTNLRSRIVFLARAAVGFAEGTEA